MKIRKILSGLLAVLMIDSCLSVVSFASETASTEKVVTISYVHSSQGMVGEDGVVSTTDEFGRSITRYYGDTESTRNLTPGGPFGDESTGAYKAMKLVYRTNGDTAPTLIHYSTDNSTSYDSQETYKHTHTANQWNVAYFPLEYLKMFQIKCGKSSTGEYLDVAYIGAFATMDEAVAHTVAGFEGTLSFTGKAKLGTEELEDGTHSVDLANSKTVPELTIPATGDTYGVVITNGTIAEDGTATSKITVDGTDKVTVNFTNGKYHVDPVQIKMTSTGATGQRCTREDGYVEEYGRTVQKLFPDNSKSTGSIAPAYFSNSMDATTKALVTATPTKYKAVKFVFYTSGSSSSAPYMSARKTDGSSLGNATAESTAAVAGKWNVAYFDFSSKITEEYTYLEALMFHPYGGDSVSNHMNETIYIGYMGLFADVADAKEHKSEFEGDVVITSAKAGANALTISNGVATFDLAGASAVPELVITATGDTSDVTIENAKLTATSGNTVTSYVKNGNETILTVNFTGGEYAPITPAELTATAATSDTDYDGIEDYRVQSGTKTDDFGRTTSTYKPSYFYFTGDENGTQDIYVTGNLRANVEVPSTVTKENYKTVKLVYRSTSTEAPTLASGTKTYAATNATSVAANEWNTLYYDYTELSAADSFIINLTEGTDPEEYKDETWGIGYLGLMEDATAAQAHTSAFEGEFAITEVLLDGTSIGNVTSYTQALNGAGEVPALTVKATGDTSKVTITNGTIDGEGKATSKVTNDGEDVVVVSFTGGDATFRVTDILVDGNSIGSFDAATASYSFDLGFGAQQPVVTYTYAGAAKELTITTVPATDQNDLVSKYTVTIADGTTVLYTLVFNVDTSLDSRLVNSLYRLQVDKELNVAYFGGSVTNGFYSGFVTDWLKENYGTESTVGATITAAQCSIGGSGSMFAVHRLKEHVVEYMATQVPTTAKSKLPDLVFIECAINDVGGYDPVYKADGTKLAIADSNQQYINAESMVRQFYAANPKIDIIFVITGDYSRLRADFTSDTPVFGTAYTELAKHYDIPIMYVGRELVRDNFETYPASAKDEAWTKFIKSDGVHPTEAGGKDYADTITAYLAEDLPKTFTPAAKDYADKTMPETVYCTVNNKGDLIVDAGLVDIEKVDASKLGGWTVGTAQTKGLNYPLLSSKGGDVFSFETNATNVWLWLHAKDTETELVWTVDGGEPKSKKFSLGNPNNFALELAEGLDNTKTHTIRLYHSDANPVDIRSIMLSGMPEGTADATITPVPYFDMTTEEYTVKVGGVEFEDFDPAVTSYEIPVDSLAEGEGYPEVEFVCRDDYYGYAISQADLTTGDNSAELSVDNVAAYTFSFTIGDAVEVDSVVKESAYKAGDAKIVLAKAAEYPIQFKAADAEWTDADAITTYPTGTTALTGLAAGEYTFRYVVAEGNYGTAGTARIWNKYPTENVYYVSDNGTGDGSSPENAAKNGKIDSTIINAKAYFGTKAATETCYVAIVDTLTTSGTTYLEMKDIKDLVITGEKGAVFHYQGSIRHSALTATTGKLTWKDLDFFIGNPNAAEDKHNNEINYNALGGAVEFDGCRTIGYATNASGQTRTSGITTHYGVDGAVTGMVGNEMIINSPEFDFDGVMLSGYGGGTNTGYVNFVINDIGKETLTICGRGGSVSPLIGVTKAYINGGTLATIRFASKDGIGPVNGTAAVIMNGGTVDALKEYSNVATVGTENPVEYTEDTVDKVVIFNNGTTATTVEKTNLDYIINSAAGGSVDITTSTDAANLYRLTGFTFTTNKSSVVIKNGDETVKTLTVTDGKASVTTAELAAGEYTVTYENPTGIASISAKIKLGRGANKATSANNGLKLEIRKADGTVLKTIELEDANTVTDEDGYINVNLQSDVTDITEDNITIVAVKNGYAPYSKTTTKAELISALEAFFEEVDDNFEKGHGDIKGSYDDTCGDGKVDFDDFVRVIRGFNKPEGESEEYDRYEAVVDLDEDGVITVQDLEIIKGNFGYGTEGAE